jgi:SAM-dependent methyltransferase
MTGIDLCCCTGAGMRWLVRFRGVRQMTGVDATPRSVERGQQRCRTAGFTSAQIRFVLADVCASGLSDASADFIWGEDAWCYVVEKPTLIAEATRLVRGGGVIAFTDWVEGPTPLTAQEADRFLRFMKFPSLADRDGYVDLLRQTGCTALAADDTGRYAPCMDLYLQMLDRQLQYDALRILGFDGPMMQALADEMRFIQGLAHAGKIMQGRFVARKP